MVKTPPERLAAALRANLRRRKAAPASAGQAPSPPKPTKDPVPALEKPRPGPPAKG
jgi:hypothetical protein